MFRIRIRCKQHKNIKKTEFLTCDEDIRDRFDLGSSRMLLYIDDAGEDVGINEIPEPMPKFRAEIERKILKYVHLTYNLNLCNNYECAEFVTNRN